MSSMPPATWRRCTSTAPNRSVASRRRIDRRIRPSSGGSPTLVSSSCSTSGSGTRRSVRSSCRVMRTDAVGISCENPGEAHMRPPITATMSLQGFISWEREREPHIETVCATLILPPDQRDRIRQLVLGVHPLCGRRADGSGIAHVQTLTHPLASRHPSPHPPFLRDRLNLKRVELGHPPGLLQDLAGKALADHKGRRPPGHEGVNLFSGKGRVRGQLDGEMIEASRERQEDSHSLRQGLGRDVKLWIDAPRVEEINTARENPEFSLAVGDAPADDFGLPEEEGFGECPLQGEIPSYRYASEIVSNPHVPGGFQGHVKPHGPDRPGQPRHDIFPPAEPLRRGRLEVPRVDRPPEHDCAPHEGPGSLALRLKVQVQCALPDAGRTEAKIRSLERQLQGSEGEAGAALGPPRDHESPVSPISAQLVHRKPDAVEAEAPL